MIVSCWQGWPFCEKVNFSEKQSSLKWSLLAGGGWVGYALFACWTGYRPTATAPVFILGDIYVKFKLEFKVHLLTCSLSFLCSLRAPTTNLHNSQHPSANSFSQQPIKTVKTSPKNINIAAIPGVIGWITLESVWFEGVYISLWSQSTSFVVKALCNIHKRTIFQLIFHRQAVYFFLAV